MKSWVMLPLPQVKLPKMELPKMEPQPARRSPPVSTRAPLPCSPTRSLVHCSRLPPEFRWESFLSRL